MMKEMENNLSEYNNKKHSEQKALRVRQVKFKVIMFLCIFAVAFLTILLSNQSAIGKISNSKKNEENRNVKTQDEP